MKMEFEKQPRRANVQFARVKISSSKRERERERERRRGRSKFKIFRIFGRLPRRREGGGEGKKGGEGGKRK